MGVFPSSWMVLFGPIFCSWVVLYPLFMGSFLPLYSKFTRSLRKKNPGARSQNTEGKLNYENRKERRHERRRILSPVPLSGTRDAESAEKNLDRINRISWMLGSVDSVRSVREKFLKAQLDPANENQRLFFSASVSPLSSIAWRSSSMILISP